MRTARKLGGVLSSIALVVFLCWLPASGLTFQDLNDGASFTTSEGLTFADFFVESDFYDLSTIEVNPLADGFSYSLTLPQSANPAVLGLSYSVAGLGPGELPPVDPGGKSTKKKATRKGVLGSVFAENEGADFVPFSEEGCFFLDEDTESVECLGIDGLLALGYVDYLGLDTGKKAARKKAGVPDPDAFVFSELAALGYGPLTATQHFSTGPAIPEPMSAALFGIGSLVVAIAVRRRNLR